MTRTRTISRPHTHNVGHPARRVSRYSSRDGDTYQTRKARPPRCRLRRMRTTHETRAQLSTDESATSIGRSARRQRALRMHDGTRSAERSVPRVLSGGDSGYGGRRGEGEHARVRPEQPRTYIRRDLGPSPSPAHTMVRAVAIDRGYARLSRTESTAYGHGTATLRDDHWVGHQPGRATASRWRRGQRVRTRTDALRAGELRLRGAARFDAWSRRGDGDTLASGGGRSVRELSGAALISSGRGYRRGRFGDVLTSAARPRRPSSHRGTVLRDDAVYNPVAPRISCTHSSTSKYIVCSLYSCLSITADLIRAK